MTADSKGNDLSAVNIVVDGKCAFAPVDEANVITGADGADPALQLSKDYPAYRALGLIKKDGGVNDTINAGERLEFFQSDYSIAGDDQLGFEIGLAQGDPVVLEFIRGKQPDQYGRYHVASGVPDTQYLVFIETVYKNRNLYRQNGVCQIVGLERDQAERGSVQGWKASCRWLKSPLVDGAAYNEWHVPAPAAIPDPTTPGGN